VPNARSHPVEGGSANNYDYCNGDPVNCWDLGGTKPVRPLNSTEEARLAQLLSNCSGPDAAGADISGSASCQRFRSGLGSGDLREFGIGFRPRPAGSCPAFIRVGSRFFGYGDLVRAGYRLVVKRDPGAALEAAAGGVGSNGVTFDLTKQFERAGSKIAGTVSVIGALGGSALDAVCTVNNG